MRLFMTSALASTGALITLAGSPQAIAASIALASPALTAALINLPSLRAGPSEALGVDEAGTTIVGSSWEKGLMYGVRWKRQNGAWTISKLPIPANATSAIARAVNNATDTAGNDFPATVSHPVLWSATGGLSVLGCNEPGAATVYALSGNDLILAGRQAGKAALWRPGTCRTDLPGLFAGAPAIASAINADGTIVGGGAAPAATGSFVPVRWRRVGGAWQIEQLDTRPGGAAGANATGDLAGQVSIACGAGGSCSRAFVWSVDGGSAQLGTLGGADSWARDINASGEVVGGSSRASGDNTGFFWSPSVGMVALPFKGSWAAANALSDVRPDGTRLVVGMNSQGVAVAWIVAAP